MSDLKFEDFDFNVKPDIKELEASNKLFKYFMLIQWEIQWKIKYYECKIKALKPRPLFIEDILNIEYSLNIDNINEIDKFKQYKVFNVFLSDRKLIEKEIEYLIVLRERLAELSEYLESLEKLKEFI